MIVVAAAIAEMDHLFDYATEQVGLQALATGQFKEPNLSGADIIGERFYRRVITEGWKCAHEEALIEKERGKQRLAAPPKAAVKPLQFLVEFFGDVKSWGKILSRKNFLIERLKRAYLQRLKKRFNEILPELLSGKKTPQEVKIHLGQAWGSTRGRTENIFRTETTKYFTEAQISYFSGSDVDIIGYLFDSVKDSGRSLWCKSRHGLIYRPGTDLLRKNSPPCHWQCRSHLIALANTVYNRKMLADPERDPSLHPVESLPSGWGR
jgi:SPP1 gp7 family putative phage head morphogenesis protein